MTGETFERIDGPTPNGGAYVVANFLDADGKPTTKAKAKRAEILEYDADGKNIARTYADLNP